jgi:AcrR family transcriptional regulator
MPRSYTLKRRAERQQQTRQRIVEAAIALHGTVGPARTSIQGIAEQAGVQRHTIYAYFPDEQALLQACSEHFRQTNPLPDPAQLAAVEGAEARLRLALTLAYDYYSQHEALMANVLRDAQIMPVGRGFLDHHAAMIDVVARAWSAEGEDRARARPAISLALSFWTWQHLARAERLTIDEAVELMARFVCVA